MESLKSALRIAMRNKNANCKESSHLRQEGATIFFGNIHAARLAAATQPQRIVSNITVNRRQNVITLFQQFAEEQMRAGIAPKGLEQTFAQRLQISPSMWSQIKSSRPIGDKLARQIEAACKQTPAWLDEERASQGLTASEQLFLTLALKAWRDTNAEGKKNLKQIMKTIPTSG